ncbi:MAG: DUF1571 domain-containing protein [Planctomycetales bacterium]|nr:DUF1571 domain-containing protein [Planctomycetales bacterium]
MKRVLAGSWRCGCVLAGLLVLSDGAVDSTHAQTSGSTYQGGGNQGYAPQQPATGYPASTAPRRSTAGAVSGYPAQGTYGQVAPTGQVNPGAAGGYPQAQVQQGQVAPIQSQQSRVSVADSRSAPAQPVLTDDIAQQAKINPQHPLAPVVSELDEASQVLASVQNYECIFSKREFIDGTLTETENMYFKVRHEPFSVYLYCYGPAKPKGQEAIYVEGRNNGQVVAHSTGIRAIAGTVHLDPLSARMMEGNRHPITDVGMKNLTGKLLDRYRREAQYDGTVVKEYDNVQVAGRTCKCIEITHPQQYRPFDFYVMRIYLDKQWKVPVCMQAYGWPTQAGGAPQLVEEYTYSQLKFNVAMTDRDFDPNNPNYGY